jgi:hypothetical protein
MFEQLKKDVSGYIHRVVKGAVLAALDEDASQVHRQLKRSAAASTADFVLRELPLQRGVPHRDRLFDVCLKEIPAQGLILEFGVYRGQTLRQIASRFPGRKIYGFDSFQGLPEAWINHEEGLFKLKEGELPEVPDHVELVKGWFQDTVPGFLESHPGEVALLHIDSDLYSSCKYVLQEVGPRLVPGSIVMFDDYFNYPGWEEGEHRAFREWVADESVRFECLGFLTHHSPDWWRDGSSGQQVGMRILSAPRSSALHAGTPQASVSVGHAG